MAEKITLSTNLKTVQLDFADRGATAEIQFDPTDPNLAVRFSEMEGRIKEEISKLPEVELDADGKPKDLSFIENIKEINQIIYEEIDRVFGNKISQTVFQYCSPFSVSKGRYFVMQFIEAIAPLIRKNIAEENKALNKHLAKYTK